MQELRTLDGSVVRRVAFGAEQLGGYEWGVVDLKQIERAVTYALELGGVFFDTADCYGRGESERRLGNLLKGRRRDRSFLATKFGVRFTPSGQVYYDNSPDYAERALDQSLARLCTHYVDLLQVHWPDARTPIALILEKLERLREKGKLRWYGLTNFSNSEIPRDNFLWPGLATFSNQFSALERQKLNSILDACRRTDLVFLSWGSLGQGLLSGKYAATAVFLEGDRRSRLAYANFHGERLRRNVAIARRISDLANHFGEASTSQLAIRFVLESIPRSVAIVGVKSLQQFEENSAALEFHLPEDIRNALLQIAVESVA